MLKLTRVLILITFQFQTVQARFAEPMLKMISFLLLYINCRYANKDEFSRDLKNTMHIDRAVAR